MEIVKNIIESPFRYVNNTIRNLTLIKQKEKETFIYLLFAEKFKFTNSNSFLVNIYDDMDLAEEQKEILNNKYDNYNDIKRDRHYYFVIKKKCNEPINNVFMSLETTIFNRQ